MELLDLTGARGDEIESPVELREVGGPDSDVKLAEFGRAEPEFAPREAPSLDASLRLEVPEIGVNRPGELKITA